MGVSLLGIVCESRYLDMDPRFVEGHVLLNISHICTHTSPCRSVVWEEVLQSSALHQVVVQLQ